jgi:Protein of unknown function (DUF1573)
MMARPVYWAVLGGWLVVGFGAGLARADAWTDALFAENQHDFGMVPRGVKVKHDFALVNRLGEAITIVNLRPSCGCTSGRASASQVGPGQSAFIEAEMDTRNFVGAKSTILYVNVVTASGREGEARLGVSSMILSDIVMNPGAIDFGAVARGQSPTKTLTIDRINAPGWKFVRMVSASRAINAQLAETSRTAASISYTLTVNLKPDAPTGFMRDEIRLISNDAEAQSIPLMVTAWVRGELTAAPSVVSLGQIHSAAAVQGRFVVRASKPFAIRAIEGSGDGFSTSLPDGKRQSMHVVTVAYRPDEGTTRGDIRHIFRVLTDLPGEPPLDLTATLHIDP